MMHLKTLLVLALAPWSGLLANPVFTGADPHAVVIDDRVWIYPTHSEGGRNFMAYRSDGDGGWEKFGPVLDLKDVPWLKGENPRQLGPWAPCLAEKDGRYYFYYSVGPQSESRPSRIGVASAATPAGPFKDSGKPLLTGGDGFEAIDPMVFQDPASGKYYFYAGGSAGAKLRIFELGPGMTEFEKEIETATPPQFTEAPFMHVHGGLYHLTYSHGGWRDATYSVHHATSESPVGPWKYRGVILKSDSTHKGPGHHSIIRFPGEDDWRIVYHRWNDRRGDGPYRGPRETAIDPLVHRPDGSIAPVQMK